MTGNREDYIKAIYELGGKENRISTKDIAFALNISPPSVSEMIKKLVEEGYLEYELYKGVMLTRKGFDEAFRIKKRHLLWEVFLVDKLGYAWEDVHEEAEVLEHITSPKLEEHLDKFLGYPKVCPHGTPLEDYRYTTETYSLDNMIIGESIIIKRIEDEKNILRFVNDIELKIGDLVEITNRSPDGIVRVEKDNVSIDIEKNLAEKIYVESLVV